MTGPVDPVAASADGAGSGGVVDAPVRPDGAVRPGGLGRSERLHRAGGEAATFEALVERAARSGDGPGGLVRELPTGAAAKAWAHWAPPPEALGSLPASGSRLGSGSRLDGSVGGLGPAALSPGGGLGPAGLSPGVAGVGASGLAASLTAGRTGVVFPQARSAGEAVINAAADHLGVPYLWGGTDAERGFDCSGLIQDAYRRIGVEMPKWSRHQATMGVEVPSVDQALPGDILSFGQPVDHVGLYVGDGRMLHAPRTGDVVKISSIERPIGSIRRIVTPTGGGSIGAPNLGGPTLGAPNLGGPATGTPYRDLFESAGQRWGVDPGLLAAVAKAESGFDPRAVSPVGAQGLMQFMPATAAEMGVDPWDPASAIDGAARYLRRSIDRFDSIEEAIASYNAGPGAVARYGGIPPFPETQNYVRTVLAAWRS